MTTHRTLGLLLVAAFLSGCAHAIQLPPPSRISFDGQTASYHDYATLPICQADGKQLAGELGSVNAVLTRFIELFTSDPDQAWTADQIHTLREAKANLPKVIDIHESNLKQLARCHDLKGGLELTNASARGQKLVDQARERLEKVPKILAKADYEQKLQRWKQGQGAEIQKAHGLWCPPKPRPAQMPEIYYAASDETGRTAYLFCDGSQVVGTADDLKYRPPANETDRQRRYRERHHPSRLFVKATAHFPADQVKRPPAGPGAAQAQNGG